MDNKFKVGDIVTCVDSVGCAGISKGRDYTIVATYEGYVSVLDYWGQESSYSTFRFELKEDTKPVSNHKFKVGDKVRQSDKSTYMFGTDTPGTKGVIGTITRIPDKDSAVYTVDFGYVGYDVSDWTMTEEELELVQSVESVPVPQSGKIKSDGGSSTYYQFPDGAKELNDLIEHKDMSFARGNMFKALYRLGEKEGIDVGYDLNKMQLFLDRLKEMHKKGKRL